MSGPQPTGVRLRQAVLVAHELEPAFERLRDGLRIGEPFRDPDVGLFGLENTVCPIGDEFIEIISPVGEGTAAGRLLDRRGDGGYMLIFQVDDLEGARQRARDMGVRTAFEIDLDEISCTHLHPADLEGAIVSIDRPEPPGSWRWGGPDWIGKAGHGAPGKLTGVTVQVAEPEKTASRWAEVLGLEPDRATLRLDRNQTVAFEAGTQGLTEIKVQLPTGPAEPLGFGAAQVTRI